MLPEPVTVTLESPSARLIRETKMKLWAEWEADNNMPGEPIVKRGYDLARGCAVARITIRSIIPANFRWSEQ